MLTQLPLAWERSKPQWLSIEASKISSYIQCLNTQTELVSLLSTGAIFSIGFVLTEVFPLELCIFIKRKSLQKCIHVLNPIPWPPSTWYKKCNLFLKKSKHFSFCGVAGSWPGIGVLSWVFLLLFFLGVFCLVFFCLFLELLPGFQL